MSERHDEHGTTPEGEPEGFIDRVKDFFGIRDETDDGHDPDVEHAEEADSVPTSATDEAVREADTDEYDREELQKALDEAATDGQPNSESGDLDTPIGQDPQRRADDVPGGPDDTQDSTQTERHTRHDVTRQAGGPAADDIADSGPTERRTRHEVTRETGAPNDSVAAGATGAAEVADARDAEPDVEAGTDVDRELDAVTSRDTDLTADTDTTADTDIDTTADADTDTTAETDTDTDTDEERARREEEFAREHDPEQHDVSAGEEFRQSGDWTADEHGGPQVQDASGEIHDPGTGPGESSIEDVRDGGHGVGSAAPLPDGRQPFGHPVKAWTDTMTFVLPGEEGYDADPHEWFVDQGAAEGAGFRHAHGG